MEKILFQSTSQADAVRYRRDSCMGREQRELYKTVVIRRVTMYQVVAEPIQELTPEEMEARLAPIREKKIAEGESRWEPRTSMREDCVVKVPQGWRQ